MFLAQLLCSDESCAESIETWGTLHELEASACECGCTLQVIAISEIEFVEPEPIVLFELPLAA
jgi:hypothetical protein